MTDLLVLLGDFGWNARSNVDSAYEPDFQAVAAASSRRSASHCPRPTHRMAMDAHGIWRHARPSHHQRRACPSDGLDGAFDPAGNCAGAAPIIVNEGLAYFNLPIYGDDASTADLDEGITAGEPFTLRIWQAASNSFATYPNDDAPEYLDGWSNTNGAPIPDYSDPSVIYDFTLEVNLFIVYPEATCAGGPVQTLEWGPPGGLITAPA